MEKDTSFGPYELLARLSAGGAADVFRAKDTRTGTLCALKRLGRGAAEDEELVVMFEDEARIAAELDHPSIAKLLDFGTIEGRLFIAYELVDGRDLEIVFTDAALTEEPLPLPFLLYVLTRVAEALEHAHARAVIHRDVTPRNVMVSFDGDVKLIDFGIARAKGRIAETAAGTLKGKLGYMSPEQVRGEPLDARTDLFSLGICMWEGIAGKRLFSDPNEFRVLDMVKHLAPDPPSAGRRGRSRGRDVRQHLQDLDRIVLKSLAKNASERYGSAREVTKDLNAFVGITRTPASRDAVAGFMRRAFGDRTMGRIMQLQETRMSDDNKGGSDLDIFEGLGKKSSSRTSAVPPPPPGSSSHVQSARPANLDPKKTLLGIPEPAQSPSQTSLPASPPSSQPAAAAPPSVKPSAPPAPPSASMRAVAPAPAPSASKPPPPPGRGSLPNLAATNPTSPSQSGMPAVSPSNAPSATQKVSAPPPAPSTRPTPAAQANGGKLDMDWDDDDEATHVFDKESQSQQEVAAAGPESRRPEHASMDEIMTRPSQVPSQRISQQAPAAGTPPPPPAPSTLSGAFGALGQPRESVNGHAASSPPSAQFRSGPPASQSLRSAPPPPPASIRQPNPSTSTAPMPPPPPPGQTTTAPMHMPLTSPMRQPSQPPPTSGHMPVPQGSVPPHHSAPPMQQQISQPPMPQMPPVNRAMEATAMVPRPQQGKAGLWVGLLVGVFAAVAVAVFFMMPRAGTLVVNVADSKGGAVSRLEVIVDGKKSCESAPCIVKDVSTGVHEVKVVAQGFEAPAPRAVTIESRKDATMDFTLTPAKNAGGTGLKVAGNQSGVRLVVDGKEYGPLPQELRDLSPGDHTVKIVGSERYAAVEKTVKVTQDELTDLGSVSLKVLKGKATIQLGTPGAKVYLVSGTNRKEVPQFPIAIDFDPSEKWQLEAKKDGFDDYSQPISFDDGQAEKTIVVTLNAKGTTPATPAFTPATTPAAPVAHAPAAPVAHAPAAPAAKEPPSFIAPAAKEPATAAAPAKPAAAEKPAAAGGEAFLNINSLPASTVLLDGKPLGPTPRLKVSVSPGAHTIVFVNAEQQLKKSISVTVGAGETKAAFAKLRTE